MRQHQGGEDQSIRQHSWNLHLGLTVSGGRRPDREGAFSPQDSSALQSAFCPGSVDTPGSFSNLAHDNRGLFKQAYLDVYFARYFLGKSELYDFDIKLTPFHSSLRAPSEAEAS